MYLSEDLFKACKRAMELIRDDVPPAFANYKAGKEWGFEASDVAKGLSELRKRKRKRRPARSKTPSPALSHRGETKNTGTLRHDVKKRASQGKKPREAQTKELRDAGTSQMILSQ